MAGITAILAETYMAGVTAEKLKAAIVAEPCLFNARHHGDCLTVSIWVNETYPQKDPKDAMTPEAVAALMAWPLKLGMVHPPPAA
jgi:hypothetical protein